MLEVYLPVLLMLAIAVSVPVVLFVLSTVMGPRAKPSAEKMMPYESGSETEGAAHVRLSVKFYLTAILFVVFDIEAVFLYPWAAQFRELGWAGFVEMVLFIAVLAITLVYAWRKGALEWLR